MTNTSLIIGKNVSYTKNKKETIHGLVLDKITMLQTSEESDSNQQFEVTGYLIQSSEDKKVYPISYWRIKEVLD